MWICGAKLQKNTNFASERCCVYINPHINNNIGTHKIYGLEQTTAKQSE